MTSTNVRSHTGTVHAARTLNGRPVPACKGNAVQAMHYAVPTADAVTCKRCAPAARSSKAATPAERAEAAAAREVALAEFNARAAAKRAERAAWLLARADELAAAGDPRAAACRAEADALA